MGAEVGREAAEDGGRVVTLLLCLVGAGLGVISGACAKLIGDAQRARYRARLQTFAQHGRAVRKSGGGVCPCSECAAFRREVLVRS